MMILNKFIFIYYINCFIILFFKNFINSKNLIKPQLKLVKPSLNKELFVKFNKELKGIDIKSGSFIHLRCKGTEELIWKQNKNTLSKSTQILSTTKNTCSNEKYFFYTCFIELILKNVTFHQTGAYSCHYKDYLNDKLTDSIYLFINDNMNLLFLPYNFNVKYIGISVIQSQSVLIPCLATNSRANVTLWKPYAINEPKQILLGKDVSYKPTEGFYFHNPRWNDELSYLECHAYLSVIENNISYTFEDKIIIHIQWSVEPIYGLKPFIEASNIDNVPINGSFSLKCIIHIETGVLAHAFFIHPNNGDHRIIKHKPVTIKNTSDPIHRVYFNLIIKNVSKSDEGIYYCNVSDSNGKIYSTNVNVTVNESSFSSTENTKSSNHHHQESLFSLISFIISIIILIAILFASFLTFKSILRLKENEKLVVKNLYNAGNSNEINPNLPLNEQVEYLAYDCRWEFREENLKLIDIIGEGAFGRVALAEAKGENGVSTLVAVKMLKQNSDYSQKKALIDELKILTHLGRHVNIVNCLGAVTKDMEKLKIIVEYCPFGNLKQYLSKRRKIFSNQINPLTGVVDCNYDLYNFSENLKKKLHQRKLTTTDLLCYSFQIARGMEYLEKKQLIHRDLAARNVLVADKGILKICDFGMAKNIEKEYIYFWKSDGLLPIKWMAIESIVDRLFTIKSDVWSFGILLWEIFTLGCDPYPNFQVNQLLLKKIINGYRMEKSDFCPPIIYEIMKKCWHVQPSERPNFKEIVSQLGDMIGFKLRNYFHEI